jgi:alkyl sulfatase BDS1-like metallo-beta-lactamase superfamily hydrolase
MIIMSSPKHTRTRTPSLGLFVNGLSACIALLLCSALSLGAHASNSEQRVNPELLELQQRQKPILRKLGARVYATEFIGYSNHGFIEGDDGIIVIDGGWFPTTTQRAITELREYTDKPVAAIIYTHLHLDHFGGIGPIMANQPTDIPVYGPAGWEHWVTRLLRQDRESILRRVYLQMGMLLPQGENGTVGNGIGPSPIPEPNDPLSFPPTIDVDQTLDVVIAGVPLRIMPMEGDVTEHIWVWLPEDRILFSGDSPPHGVFPAVETARFEIGRNPDEMLRAVETSLALQPEAIVPGHSRILRGRDEIDRIMSDTRDAIGFLVDQVNRFFLTNRSADELLDTVTLPPAIIASPDLQPYYHRWEWMVRQRFIKLGGFIDDSMDYLSLNALEESRRLVPLLGGVDRVLALAETSIDGDPRWSARLATYILHTDTDNEDALAIRQRAFLRVAQTTNSANERNYMLGLILEEQGKIDFPRQLAPLNQRAYAQLDNRVLLERLKARVKAEDADHINQQLALGVGQDRFLLTLRNNVLFIDDITQRNEQTDKPDANMTREELIAVVSHVSSLTALPGWHQTGAQTLASLIDG